MKKSLKKALLVLSLAIPTLVFAQGEDESAEERRRFWGQDTTTSACVMGYQTVTTTTYAFWIGWWSESVQVHCN